MTAQFIRDLFEKNLKAKNLLKIDVKTYKDAHKYAERVSDVLIETLENAKLSGYVPDELFVKDLLRPLLNRDFMLCKDACEIAQDTLNKELKIGLKAIAPRSKTAIDHIETIAYMSDNPIDAVKQGIGTFGHKIVNDSVKRNADFQARAGMKIYIERVNNDVGLRAGTKYAEPCKYCDTWAGTFEYPNIPAEVWGFHDGCKCEATYYNVSRGTEERIH